MSIKRAALCSSVIAFAVAAQVASAQTPLPKVWPMYYPRGDAATDPIFTRMITYNMAYSAVTWRQKTWLGGGSACGSVPPAYLGSPEGTYVPDPEDVADRIALEAIWRGQTRTEFDLTPDEDVAISIVRFADPVATRSVSTEGPSLYDDGGDWIEVPRTRLCGTPVYQFRTVWMTNGIAAARSWMEEFVDRYEAYTTGATCGTVYRAAIPSRFIFDQEPAPILLDTPIGMLCDEDPMNACTDGYIPFSDIDPDYTDPEKPRVVMWEDMYDYWTALKGDGRFGTGCESSGVASGGVPVPGCGGKTLWRLWWEARNVGGLAEPTQVCTPTYLQYYWKGESEENQAWFRWFSAINHQANIGAMDEAAFQVIHAKWPGCMSSDYENSMRTTAYMFRGDVGADGPTGIAYPVETQFNYDRASPDPMTETASPMEAGVLNALHFYPDVGPAHWLKFRQESAWYGQSPSIYPSEIQRWGNTGGANEYTYSLKAYNGRESPLVGSDTYANDGDEFWEATSLRVNNFELSRCFRANLPSGDYDDAEGMTAWITLPNQPIIYFGLAQYNGLTYNDGVTYHSPYLPVRQSAYGLYRTVADCRMHGVNEFMVWNDTGQDADSGWDGESPEGYWGAHEGRYTHGGLHPDRAANWNILRQVMHQVYAYDCTVEAIRGSYATDMSYSSGSPHFVERLRYADQTDADSTAVRAVKVDPAGGASNQTARIQLKFTPNGSIETTGDYINFEVRLKTNIAGSVRVEVLDVMEETTAWIRLGSGQLDTLASDVDGKHFYLYDIPTDEDFRTIRFRLPRTSAQGHSLIDWSNDEVNIRITGNLGESSPSITIDNAICYISNAGKFHPADLNTDGVVDSKDDDLFTLLNTYSGPSNETPSYRQYIDYNRDNDFSSPDAADALTWADIYSWSNAWSLDAHRYSMLDIAMAAGHIDDTNATCLADYGVSGGVPGQDGIIDNNDFIVFLDLYLNDDSAADIGIAGGVPGSDSTFDTNDLIVYVNRYFEGCTH